MRSGAWSVAVASLTGSARTEISVVTSAIVAGGITEYRCGIVVSGTPFGVNQVNLT